MEMMLVFLVFILLVEQIMANLKHRSVRLNVLIEWFQILFVYYEKKSRNNGKIYDCQEWSWAYYNK